MRWQAHTFDCDGLTWSQLTDRLAAFLTLRAKSDDRFVILSHNNQHRFVQFADDVSPGAVRCETISNKFLPTSEPLSKDTISHLASLGWKSPTKRIPNFWRVYGNGTDASAPATLAVRTMRDVFEAAETASLHIDCGVLASAGASIDTVFTTGAGLPRLKRGHTIVNLTTGATYRIGTRLGEGGFGAAYEVTQQGRSQKVQGKLCLKIASQPEAWHREAYFGQLLEGVPAAIAVYDSFATLHDLPGWGQLPLYCLVTELAKHGDLCTYMATRQKPWTETRACREVASILRVLMHLHGAGAVHRDLTPGNVLVTDGEHLKLGDFGIARHRLGTGAVSADAFNPWFAPPPVADGMTSSWRAADDVYQMGVILAMLLGASMDERPESTNVKGLLCSPAVKAIVQRAIGDRRKRYQDAASMRAAIEARNQVDKHRASPPVSLEGKYVVFTGLLSAMSRREAAVLAKRRGAKVQPKVTSKTDILVKGTSGKWKADEKGQKLLDRDREAERGHWIPVIGRRQFLRLVR